MSGKHMRPTTTLHRRQPAVSATAIGRSPAAAATPAASRRLRVTVIGLLPAQARSLEEKLKGRATFRFVDKTLSGRRRSAAFAGRQDVIVLSADFIGHAIQDNARRAAAGTDCLVVIHHGCVAGMFRRLDALLAS